MSEEEKDRSYGDKCPECSTPWTKTPRPVVVGNYWHCLKCKKKAEDVPPKLKGGGSYQKMDDIMDSWGVDDWKMFTKTTPVNNQFKDKYAEKVRELLPKQFNINKGHK